MGNTVFISWSGERSRSVAEALREWLPAVLQAVDPWMSAADVEKGTRWDSEIQARLDESDVGIICLTPENLGSPWLLFEAGALSKKLKSRVCTYLLELNHQDVRPPLGMFQHTLMLKDDTRKLMDTINNSQAKPIGKATLDRSFDALWPSLEQSIKAIPKTLETSKPLRTVDDMIAELLEIARGLPAQVAAQVGALERDRLLQFTPMERDRLLQLSPLERDRLLRNLMDVGYTTAVRTGATAPPPELAALARPGTRENRYRSSGTATPPGAPSEPQPVQSSVVRSEPPGG